MITDNNLHESYSGSQPSTAAKQWKRPISAVLLSSLSITFLATQLTSCTSDNDIPDFYIVQPGGAMGGGSGSDDGNAPDFDATITAWNGQTADDAALDAVGTDKDFYHELNTFSSTVTVDYANSSATVSSSNSNILCHTDGAYVTIDMLTNSVDKTEIIVSGTTADGGLKIYGSSKFKLTMNGVDITSKRGPAINSQCKKRIYVHLADGTTNRLTDAPAYSDDPYYLDPTDDEDRKGCFFSEGNLIFSGTGPLVVAGKYKHAIATDGYLYMRPGVTIAVTEAAKNAIHVKGDEDDGIGFYMAGGLVYTNVASTAGKGIKTDLDVMITAGQLMLNTSGEATYDDDDQDTSSAAGIKADRNVSIAGGTLTLKSTGTGGKGINADGDLTISGGSTTITTTGGKYYYTQSLTSSPKGVKADGNINISGGILNIAVTGVSDGSEGLESKSTLTISGGEVYVYAYDDAINAASAIDISGGRVYAYASNNDGIDSNGSLTVSGGIVIGVGASSPESGIDCDSSNSFRIDGGTVIALGGSLQSNPSSSSAQRSVVYNGIAAAKGSKVSLLDSNGVPLLTFEFPRTISGASFLFSVPDLASSQTYTLSTGGTLTGYDDNWNGWYDGGTWTNGSQVGSITCNSTVTTVGTSFGGHGGGFGGHGGW